MAQDLLNQPTNKVLFGMSVPISLGMLSTILFQVVDTYFVGTLGAAPLTALGFAATIYFVLIGLYIGLSVATSIIVGTARGEDNKEKVKQSATISIVLSFGIAVLFSIIGFLSLRPIFSFMGADESIMEYIAAYMIPMFIGMPILSVGIVGGSILRATGNVKLPEIIFGIAGIINVILDYLFIFGKLGFPALGIQGVAIGTVISWIFILICIFYLLIKNGFFVSVIRDRKQSVTILKSLYSLGLPSVVTQIIAPFTLLFITWLLGNQDPAAVAAYGVAGRIETLLMIGIMGVSTASTPFIAQNVGAKNVARVDQAIVFGGKAAFYLGGLVIILLFLFIKPIVSLFSADATIISYASSYFYIVSGSYILYGLYLITASIFNGLQMPNKALKIMAVKTFLFTLPLAYAGSFIGIHGIFIGIAISNVAGGIYARLEMRKELKRVNSSLVKRNPFMDMLNDFKMIFKRPKRV